MKKPKRKAFSVVVPINPLGEVLMGLRTEDGKWTTPAGGANPGESPTNAAIREAGEEAALEILPDQLELLYVKKTPFGCPISCYLFRTPKVFTSPESDPDEEVLEWKWIHPDDFPKDFFEKKNDVRRPTILDAIKRFNAPSATLPETSATLSKSNVFQDAGKALSSGGKEALLTFLQNIRPKNPELSEAVYRRIFPNGDLAELENFPEVKKSVVQMVHHSDGGDLRTEAAALERAYADPALLQRLVEGMRDFSWGDIPVEFPLDEGTLFLTKVDDGLYSGFFQKITMVEGFDEPLVDTAKVRIEKQTLPTLCQFLCAKGWVHMKASDPTKHSVPDETETLEMGKLTQKLEILRLLERMTS